MKSYKSYLNRTVFYNVEIKLINVMLASGIQSYTDWAGEDFLENTKYQIMDEVFLTE